MKEPKTKARRGFDKLGLTGLLVVLALLTVGTVVIFQHLIESLDDNSKKMSLYTVKPTKGAKSIVHLIEDNLERSTFKDRHHLAAQFYDRGNELSLSKKGSSGMAIDMYKRCLVQYDKDLRVQPAHPDDNATLRWAYKQIATTLFVHKQYKEALVYANKAIKTSDNSGDRMLRAKIYDALGNSHLSAIDRERARQIQSMNKDLENSVVKDLLPDMDHL